MGVISCSRKDCDEIMCDRYIDDIGNICYECSRELQEYIESKLGSEYTYKKSDLIKLTKEFMVTPKDNFDNSEISLSEFIKSRH